MKQQLIYSLTIFLIIFIIILLQMPSIIYDDNGLVKSWNYFKNIDYKYINSINDLICLPTIIIIVAVISFILGRHLTK